VAQSGAARCSHFRYARWLMISAWDQGSNPSLASRSRICARSPRSTTWRSLRAQDCCGLKRRTDCTAELAQPPHARPDAGALVRARYLPEHERHDPVERGASVVCIGGSGWTPRIAAPCLRQPVRRFGGPPLRSTAGSPGSTAKGRRSRQAQPQRAISQGRRRPSAGQRPRDRTRWWVTRCSLRGR
jgi:hypothetical protein